MAVMTAAQTTSPADRPPLGLRERKKIKTRTAIRTATFGLIEEQGYEATTVEQIADRAEVSPSTVFRYFPTKEDIVLTDEYDPLMLADLRQRPADEPLLESVRFLVRRAVALGFTESPDLVRLRMRLMVDVPAVRSRAMESLSATGGVLCRGIGERTGRDPGSLEVRIWAMALVGGMMEASLYWAENGYRDDLAELFDRAVEILAHGPGVRENP
ncbi:TetR family transcriptional regulator [Streptomyces sp. NPDC048290]|uniref:TetR/AcrR family transcriptional regulator n=1 Tax=Streptomyces sp. NPDC048290 TaxID=3155811 RepID=UPI003433A01E